MTDEKIIVSMTSWKKRINKVGAVVKTMLEQTHKPDKIILNLSSDEFTGMESELPEELIALTKNELFEIFWVKENTKPYKKLIPTLDRFPNDVIITIDDDIPYPKNFISEMYNEYLSWGKQCPITSGTFKWENDIFTHYGCFSLVKKEFFGDYLCDLYENLYKKMPEDIPFSDVLFTYAILLNGKRYKFTNNLNMSEIRDKAGQDEVSLSKRGTGNYNLKIRKEHDIIRKYIFEKYNKTYDDLFDAKVHVNLTTWTKRDFCLPKMLENFKKQTKTPDKIILWLSRDEYCEEKLPEHIENCLNQGLLTDIMWVDKNIYCHKRHECFKIYNDVYNIFVDDDILYRNDFVEELVKNSKRYQNYPTCTIGRIQNYVGANRIMTQFTDGTAPSINNQFLGGLTCFPPYSFPVESYLYEEIRDKFVHKCDESWLVAWFIKKNIKVNVLHDFHKYGLNLIGDTQKTALYNENKQVQNGVRVKEKTFSNAIMCVGVIDKVRQIWPNFEVEKCCDSELIKNLSIDESETDVIKEGGNKGVILNKKVHNAITTKQKCSIKRNNLPQSEHSRLMEVIYHH